MSFGSQHFQGINFFDESFFSLTTAPPPTTLPAPLPVPPLPDAAPSEPVNTLISTILARVRDPQGAVHSRALTLELLCRLTQLYANKLQLVQETITIGTAPFLQFYPFELMSTRFVTITNVLHNNRELDRLTLGYLKAISREWPRMSGPRYEGYIQLGYSHLILFPSLAVLGEVEVTGTVLTPLLSSEEDSLPISNQQIPSVLQLVELLLLHRQRDLPAFAAHLKMMGYDSGTKAERAA